MASHFALDSVVVKSAKETLFRHGYLSLDKSRACATPATRRAPGVASQSLLATWPDGGQAFCYDTRARCWAGVFPRVKWPSIRSAPTLLTFIWPTAEGNLGNGSRICYILNIHHALLGFTSKTVVFTGNPARIVATRNHGELVYEGMKERPCWNRTDRDQAFIASLVNRASGVAMPPLTL